MTNITPLPLAQLAVRISKDIALYKQSSEEVAGAHERWVAAALDLCIHLWQARDLIKDDREFSKWLTANKLDGLNDHDRRAAIEMGRHPDDAKRTLQTTTRHSLRYIFEEDFRIGHVANPKIPPTPPAGQLPAPAAAISPPPKRGRKPNPDSKRQQDMARTKKPYTAPKADLAYSLLLERMRAGLPFPGRPSFTAEVGLSDGTVQKAMDRLRRDGHGGWLDAKEPLPSSPAAPTTPAPPPADLSQSAQEKLAAAIRAETKRLAGEFEQHVQAEVKKRIEEMILPSYGDRLRKADAILEQYKPTIGSRPRWPFTSAEFRKLLAALHPDSSVERRTEMFNLLKERQDKLRNPAEAGERLSPDFPKSFADLVKRKQQTDAEKRRAKP